MNVGKNVSQICVFVMTQWRHAVTVADLANYCKHSSAAGTELQLQHNATESYFWTGLVTSHHGTDMLIKADTKKTIR